MRKKFIKKTGNKRLILIFTDWATDHGLFEGTDVPGYDIAVLSDYTDLSFNWKPMMGYDEVCLVAWGFGVFAASLSAHEIMSRVTLRMSINGTLDPVSDTRGMHLSVFNRLAYSLSPKVLWDYYSRMSATNEQCAMLHEHRPNRTLGALAAELAAIESLTIFHVPQIADWDLAVISSHDVLFPPANQRMAWLDVCPTAMEQSGHLPDFDRLLRKYIIDKESTAHQRTFQADVENNDMQRRLSDTLLQAVLRVSETDSLHGDLLEVGDDAETSIRRTSSGSKHVIIGYQGFGLINSPRSFVLECRRVLTDGGIMAFIAKTSEMRTNSYWEKIIPADCEVRLMHRIADYILIIATKSQK